MSSTGAKDLICHLLQPDPAKRAVLDEVMHHPWITKDGTHPLIPYEYIPPDPITQNMVCCCDSVHNTFILCVCEKGDGFDAESAR